MEALAHLTTSAAVANALAILLPIATVTASATLLLVRTAVPVPATVHLVLRVVVVAATAFARQEMARPARAVLRIATESPAASPPIGTAVELTKIAATGAAVILVP